MTQRKLNDVQRDVVYTQTCHAITAVGGANEALLLARLALLLMEEIGDAASIQAIIKAAQEGFPESGATGSKVGKF